MKTTNNNVRKSKKELVALVILAAIAGSISIAGCNTTEGAGKDIKAAGKGIEDAAHDAK